MSKRGRDAYHSDLPDHSVHPNDRSFSRDNNAIIPLSAISTGRVRSFRRSRTYSRAKGSYYRRKYLGAKSRGPYARVNRNSPELKSREIDERYFPVAYGNQTGTYAWGTGAPNPANNWTGTAQGGFLRALNLLGQGTDIDQRIGRKVLGKSILLQLSWRMFEAADSEGNTLTMPVQIRSMLVWDKQPNNVHATIGDILYSIYSQNNTVVPMPNSPNNLKNRDRFRVLWDCKDTLSPGGDSIRVYDKYLKLNKETIFTDGSTSADIGSISTGVLYLLLLSDALDSEPSPATIIFRPMASFCSRYRFTDS